MDAYDALPSVKLLSDLVWHMEKLARAASRLEERLDVLVWKARRGLPGDTCGPAHDAMRRPRRPMRTGCLQRPEPTPWLTKLKTERQPDGSLRVFVNNRRPFVLQPHLGALLLALAEDTGVSDDEGVGFKTVGDLAIRMSKRLETKRLSADTINKYVWKLRRELCRCAGLEAGIIQTHRRLGRRLALKRPILPGG